MWTKNSTVCLELKGLVGWDDKVAFTCYR
jgi:hypothetical protein